MGGAAGEAKVATIQPYYTIYYLTVLSCLTTTLLPYFTTPSLLPYDKYLTTAALPPYLTTLPARARL